MMWAGCLVASVISGAGGALLLFRLASTTAKCCSTDPTTNCLCSAVLARPPPQDEKCRASCDKLHLLMTLRPTGVRVCGVLITFELVITAGLRACVYTPVAVTVIASFLNDK